MRVLHTPLATIPFATTEIREITRALLTAQKDIVRVVVAN